MRCTHQAHRPAVTILCYLHFYSLQLYHITPFAWEIDQNIYNQNRALFLLAFQRPYDNNLCACHDQAFSYSVSPSFAHARVPLHVFPCIYPVIHFPTTFRPMFLPFITTAAAARKNWLAACSCVAVAAICVAVFHYHYIINCCCSWCGAPVRIGNWLPSFRPNEFRFD